jgi:glycosyltransferase involved in cell wall biosynthesis
MISIIVCTYNRDKYIYDCLKHIADNGFPKDRYEIILVNNNSTDSTERLCMKFASDYPDIPFRYYNETQQGLSFARNRGIKEASGEWMVFLDDDAMIHAGYLENLSNRLAQHPDAGAFGGVIVPEFESGAAPDWLCKWTYSWVSAIDLGRNVTLFEGGSYPIGANMGISRRAIQKCGTFNTELGRTENNLMGGEEKDIFNRLKKEGFSIWYFPDVAVTHVIPPHRTTTDFIRRLGAGVGASERLRCINDRKVFAKRCLLECFKWGATIILWVFYLITFRPACGNMLVRFRHNVTKALLGK